MTTRKTKASEPKANVTLPEQEKGFDWLDYIVIDVAPELIKQKLLDAGIETPNDLNTKPNETIGALMAAYGISLAELRRKTSEVVNNG